MKPILVLWVPVNLPIGAQGRILSIRESLDLFIKYAEDNLKPEVNVLVLPKMEGKDLSVEVFNSENVNDIDIEKLKKDIYEYTKNLAHG